MPHQPFKLTVPQIIRYKMSLPFGYLYITRKTVVLLVDSLFLKLLLSDEHCTRFIQKESTKINVVYNIRTCGREKKSVLFCIITVPVQCTAPPCMPFLSPRYLQIRSSHGEGGWEARKGARISPCAGPSPLSSGSRRSGRGRGSRRWW